MPVNINPTKAPALTLTPTQFSQQHFDLLNAQLRVYFNTLDSYNNTLIDTNNGSGLSYPHIAALDSTAQYATANNTPTIVKWSALSAGSGFTLNANNTATALYSGVYKITYSLQFANNINAVHDAIVWLRLNGDTSVADVADSTTIFTLPARKSAGVASYVCGYSEVVFAMNAGDSVGLWWGTDQAASSGGTTGVYIYSQVAQTTPMAYPATPSAIGSITFVSRI